MSSGKEILKALPSLSQEDLKQIKAATEMLIIEDEIEWMELFKAISQEIINRGFPEIKASTLIKNRLSKSFKENCKLVQEFTNKNLPNIDRIEKRKVYRLYAKILINHLLETNKNISVSNICIYSNRIPSLVNNAFPGYIEAGLLSRILC